MSVLRANFALVGEMKEDEDEDIDDEEDEGEGRERGEGDGKLIKESDDTYTVWASGRVHCEGFQAQIRVYNTHTHTHTHTLHHVSNNFLMMSFCFQMLRRQDLLSILLSFIWPQEDSVVSNISTLQFNVLCVCGMLY